MACPENTWRLNYYARRWEYQSSDGEWRINASKAGKAGLPPFNLSLEGEFMRRGSMDELKQYVERKYSQA